MVKSKYLSVIFRFYGEIGAWLSAYRADLRRRLADMNMTAVAADPHNGASAAKNLSACDIFEQLCKAFFVLAFDFAHKLEFYRNVVKALGSGGFGEGVIHFRPFVMLACRRGGKVVLGFSGGVQIIKPDFRVRAFVIRGFKEQIRDLLKAVRARLCGKECVLVPCLRFAGKRSHKVLFRH